MNLLVTTICFINRQKPGAEIYGTKYAQRLIEDILTKTPYDIRVATNEPELFADIIANSNGRASVLHDSLSRNRVWVGEGMHFNQLLKYIAFKDIDSKYDWVMYLDCDTGLFESVNTHDIEQFLNRHLASGFDAHGTRIDNTLIYALRTFESGQPELFADKFKFYNVSTAHGPFEWLDATMPSEHIVLLQNSPKLPIFCQHFDDFCTWFETQGPIADGGKDIPYQTQDMEAFEIGVSAELAGYKFRELGPDQQALLKIKFNGSNWEGIKL